MSGVSSAHSVLTWVNPYGASGHFALHVVGASHATVPGPVTGPPLDRDVVNGTTQAQKSAVGGGQPHGSPSIRQTAGVRQATGLPLLSAVHWSAPFCSVQTPCDSSGTPHCAVASAGQMPLQVLLVGRGGRDGSATQRAESWTLTLSTDVTLAHAQTGIDKVSHEHVP